MAQLYAWAAETLLLDLLPGTKDAADPMKVTPPKDVTDLRKRLDGIVVILDPMIVRSRDRLVELSTRSGLKDIPRAVIEKFATGHSATTLRAPRVSWEMWTKVLSLGEGGNPMRRTRSRKRGEERMESNSGAVRMNSMPSKRSL